MKLPHAQSPEDDGGTAGALTVGLLTERAGLVGGGLLCSPCTQECQRAQVDVLSASPTHGRGLCSPLQANDWLCFLDGICAGPYHTA